jgi:hypothetical protein
VFAATVAVVCDLVCVKRRCVTLREGDGTEQPYIAVGCASTFGEDYPALGRLLLLQVGYRGFVWIQGRGFEA